ncbi:MAG: hypothetical protein ACXW2E_00695 [Nitrososphaeraceae archaeon]
MKWLPRIFSNNVIGCCVLKPFMSRKFASNRMVPRYDHNGNIYALICEEHND